MLNGGIEYFAYEDPYPSHIYNIRQGVVFEAAPTRPGFSYHAYPWRGRMPAWILEELEKLAREQGHEQEFKKWKKQYSSMK